MGKINEKVYIIIIIILVIVSGSLLFRSCLPGNGNGFAGIRRLYNTIETGIKLASNIVSKSMAIIAELERNSEEKDARINELEIAITGLTASLNRIIAELENEITTGKGAIERSGEAVNGIESVIDRIRERGPE